MIGAQASNDQLEKILSYIDIGKKEGARVLCGGERADTAGELRERLLRAAHRARRQQQDAHLPGGDLRAGAVASRTFDTEEEALDIANDTLYGLARACGRATAPAPIASAAPFMRGASGPTAITLYPAHAAFGGYKQSGIGRENAQHDARPLPADQEFAGEL